MKFFQLTFSICLSNPMVMYKNYNRFSLLFKYLVNIQNKWRKIDYYRIRAVPLAIAVVQPYKYIHTFYSITKKILRNIGLAFIWCLFNSWCSWRFQFGTFLIFLLIDYIYILLVEKDCKLYIRIFSAIDCARL